MYNTYTTRFLNKDINSSMDSKALLRRAEYRHAWNLYSLLTQTVCHPTPIYAAVFNSVMSCCQSPSPLEGAARAFPHHSGRLQQQGKAQAGGKAAEKGSGRYPLLNLSQLHPLSHHLSLTCVAAYCIVDATCFSANYTYTTRRHKWRAV